MGYAVDNGMDVVLNKEKMLELAGKKGLDATGVWEKMVKKHPIGLQEKSFLNLIDNRVTWRLLYAWAVADVLGVGMDVLFVPVTVGRSNDKIATTSVRAVRSVRSQRDELVAPH